MRIEALREIRGEKARETQPDAYVGWKEVHGGVMAMGIWLRSRGEELQRTERARAEQGLLWKTCMCERRVGGTAQKGRGKTTSRAERA